MVTHNFETVIKHFARKGETNYLWNYVTGLRGNDSEVNVYKAVVTTVIRGNVKHAWGFDETSIEELLQDYNNNPKTFEEDFIHTLITVPWHARNHSNDALDSLIVYHSRKRNYEFRDGLIAFRKALIDKNGTQILKCWAHLHELWG